MRLPLCAAARRKRCATRPEKSHIFEKFVSFALCRRKNRPKFATRPKKLKNQIEK
jgi:hypothetical protein